MKKLLLIGSWTILLIIAVRYIMNIEFNDRPNEIIMAVMIFVFYYMFLIQIIRNKKTMEIIHSFCLTNL